MNRTLPADHYSLPPSVLGTPRQTAGTDSIEEGMNIHLLNTFIRSQLKESKHMVYMTVNPSIRQKAEKMQARSILFNVFHRACKGFIFFKFTFTDGNIHSCKALVNNPACTNI